MIQTNAPVNPKIHEAACLIAGRCRNIIQGCLREEEWRPCETEFYRIAREILEGMAAFKGAKR